MNFNLVEENWIPVLYGNGEWMRLGIRTALLDAHKIRQLAASNPMDNVALLRFLLAILYWCQGNPPDNMMSLGQFPPEWFKKLDDHKDCFNLLGDGKRFYQRSLSKDGKADKKLSATYLIHEIPTGSNFWHFRHAMDSVSGLCRACCALGLVRLPVFATSGGRGKPPGINAKPPLYAIPLGDSLAATLQLSWRAVKELGTPAWADEGTTLPHGTVPLLTGLTWVPRQVWLDQPEAVEKPCIACGRKEYLIHECIFAGIGSMRSSDDAPSSSWQDPHAIYLASDDKKKLLHARDTLSDCDAAAGQWANIAAQVLQREHIPGTRRVWVVGFATVQNDKYIETKEWTIPAPCASSSPPSQNTDTFRQWASAGAKFDKRVISKFKMLENKNSRREHPEIISLVATIRPQIEHRVCSQMPDLIAGEEATWCDAATEYRGLMQVVAKSVSPGFATMAITRRNCISAIAPDMRSQAQASKKSKVRRGATP